MGAITCYKRAIEADPKGIAAYSNLGAALQRQGRFKEALIDYQRGRAMASNQPGWREKLAKSIREAEHFAALEGKLYAFLRGEATPANPREAVVLALMCQHTKRYVASARLYADAFAAEPRLANANRYDAACSAVQAGAGSGEDARLLPDKVSAMFRNWALGWLRQQLRDYVRAAGHNDVAAKQFIRQRMAHWRRDADLPPVRDRTALEGLGENESTAWQAFWRDVDELAKRLAEK